MKPKKVYRFEVPYQEGKITFVVRTPYPLPERVYVLVSDGKTERMVADMDRDLSKVAASMTLDKG